MQLKPAAEDSTSAARQPPSDHFSRGSCRNGRYDAGGPTRAAGCDHLHQFSWLAVMAARAGLGLAQAPHDRRARLHFSRSGVAIVVTITMITTAEKVGRSRRSRTPACRASRRASAERRSQECPATTTPVSPTLGMSRTVDSRPTSKRRMTTPRRATISIVASPSMLRNQLIPARSTLPSTTPATSSPRTAGWPSRTAKCPPSWQPPG
jgi:hypothetical protein